MKTLPFAKKLHQILGKSSENSFFSPFSIQTALGMTVVGAEGDTKKCLSNLLASPLDEKEETTFFAELVDAGMAKNEAYELVTANALWLQKGQEFSQAYLNKVKECFKSEANEVDYSQPQPVVDEINEWCNKHTKEKIPSIINKDFIKADTLLILTNAIYFKGQWVTPFDKAVDGDFKTEDGKVVVAKMMKSKRECRYGDTDRFQVVDLDYQGDELSMLIMLPVGPSSAYLDNNLADAYQDACKSLRYEEKVIVHLPKFKLETSYALGSRLKTLGAELAFSDLADFTGISKERIKISEVVHKAFVECDEKGTTAAAATAVGTMRCASVRKTPSFIANHPFVFTIRNKKTNEILFCGRVANPVN